MNYLTDAFFWISTGLLVPVMVLLLSGLAYALISLGGFYGYYADRKKFKKGISSTFDNFEKTSIGSIDLEKAITAHPSFLKALKVASAGGWDGIHSQKAMADFEVGAEKQLERLKILMRVGPMLGLMGTLIPMGPALVGLATGDIASMATNMQVAFSTTVIGVFLGGVGLIMHNIRRRWFTEDFHQLQYIMDLAQNEKQ